MNFESLVIVNPMKLSLTPLVALIVARFQKAKIHVVLNITEPKPYIWRLLLPRFEKVIVTRFESVCDGDCSGDLHRDRARGRDKYLQNDVASLDGIISCGRVDSLGNTGLIALDMCSKMGGEIHLLGFNFYQGKNHNFTYDLQGRNHVKQLNEVGLELFSRFKSLVVQANKDVKFVHIVDEDSIFAFHSEDSDENYQICRFRDLPKL